MSRTGAQQRMRSWPRGPRDPREPTHTRSISLSLSLSGTHSLSLSLSRSAHTTHAPRSSWKRPPGVAPIRGTTWPTLSPRVLCTDGAPKIPRLRNPQESHLQSPPPSKSPTETLPTSPFTHNHFTHCQPKDAHEGIQTRDLPKAPSSRRHPPHTLPNEPKSHVAFTKGSRFHTKMHTNGVDRSPPRAQIRLDPVTRPCGHPSATRPSQNNRHRSTSKKSSLKRGRKETMKGDGRGTRFCNPLLAVNRCHSTQKRDNNVPLIQFYAKIRSCTAQEASLGE